MGIRKTSLQILLFAGLALLSSCGGNSLKWIYFTDTHFPDSDPDVADFFEPVCRSEGVKYVFWGGDAVARYASPDSAWAQQCAVEEQICRFAAVFNVRGNHDFSRRLRQGEDGPGCTLSQEETARRMKAFRPQYAITNDKDPGACYYYVDDAGAKVRFLVLDTHVVENEQAPMGTRYALSDIQTEWVCERAIASMSDGWSLVIFSHVPVWWMAYRTPYAEAVERIRRTASDRGIPILTWFAGHIHRDSQLAQDGMWEITNSCYTPTFSRVQMFDSEPTDREGVNRPSFDVVTLDSAHRILRCRRIGAGHSRTFHLRPIMLQAGSSKSLRPLMKKVERWECLDAFGSYLKGESWSYSSKVASFDEKSRRVIGLEAGESMVVAISPDGERESFLVRVNPSDQK